MVEPTTAEEVIRQNIEPLAIELLELCKAQGLPVLIAFQSDDITICSWRYMPEQVDNRLQVADMACRSVEVESLVRNLTRQIQLALQRH